MLLRLFIAHLLADFFFQPAKWVASKKEKRIKSIHLVFHAITHGVLAYILLADWGNPWLPLLLIVVHWSIDVIKVYRKPNIFWFLVDQILHIMSLVVLWGFFYGQFATLKDILITFFKDIDNLWIIMGYLFILKPTSLIIETATRKWQKEIKEKSIEPQPKDGLDNAGKWIGMLERILILTFIFINQFAAIGFLIAAKSIFRFGDLTENKERKLTEYILIGTFLSFTITLLIGLLIRG